RQAEEGTRAEAAVGAAPRTQAPAEGPGEGGRESPEAATEPGRPGPGTEGPAGVTQPQGRGAGDRPCRSRSAQAGHAEEDVVADGRSARGDAAREAARQQGPERSVQQERQEPGLHRA